MKLGEITVSQVKEYCYNHACYNCQFVTSTDKCLFHEKAAEKWNTDLEVVPSSENERLSFVQKLELLRNENKLLKK